MISGGDLTVDGQRNSAIKNTDVFSPAHNTLTDNTPMNYPRWYGSLVSLPNGHLAIFGGRQNQGLLSPAQPAMTPEIYDPVTTTWTSLAGATSAAAFGGLDTYDWYYPKSYVAPGGNIFVLSNDGTMYAVSTAGNGTTTRYAVTAPTGYPWLPTIPFAPVPVVTQTDKIDQARWFASGAIMADGRVLITGGAQGFNELIGVAYQAQIWDPATGHWTAGATASKPRLYHSSSLLRINASYLFPVVSQRYSNRFIWLRDSMVSRSAADCASS